ncbi:MAG: metalloregulator ArsR/SmtB family transcription factor [Leptospiraceae bacterium]|nr:metalloregulator ArsR/SmtB family transcription factor [Leptospiraceae bacterium]
MKVLLTTLKALGDETRIRILHILSQGSFHVNEIVEILEMGQSRVSRHLKILQDASLIFSRREGTWIYYYLKFDGEKNFSKELTELIQKYKFENSFYEKDSKQVQKIFENRFLTTRTFFDKIGGEAQKVQEQVLNVEIYKHLLLKFIPKNKTLLIDLGCGPGRLFSDYLKKVSKIIGVDSSQNMLSLAQNSIRDTSKIKLIQSPIEKVPLPNNTADIVILSMVLHHISSPVEALKEAHRLLKPNGTLCVIELLKHDKEFMRNVYADLWLGFEKSTLENWLKQVGFQLQTTSEISTQMDFKIIGIKSRKGVKT